MLNDEVENYLIVKFWLEASGIKKDLRAALKEVVDNHSSSDIFNNTLDKLSTITYYTDIKNSSWKEVLSENGKAESIKEIAKHIVGYEFKGKYLFLQINVNGDNCSNIRSYVALVQAFWGWFGEYIEMKLYRENDLPQMMFNVEDQIISGASEKDIPRDEWNCKKMKRVNVKYDNV